MTNQNSVSIETGLCSFAGGCLRWTFVEPGRPLDKADVDENLAIFRRFRQEDFMAEILDVRAIHEVPPVKVMTYLAKECKKLNPRPRVCAFVADSFWSRLTINFYRNVTDHNYPVKIFDRMDKAEAWIARFLEDDPEVGNRDDHLNRKMTRKGNVTEIDEK